MHEAPKDTATAFDVAVVGAGVVGTAVARLLCLHDVTVVMIDSATDVGAGTSKANTAILHTGFDATPGSIESRLVARGYELLSDYAPRVGISVEPTGAVLVAWDEAQFDALPALLNKAIANGYFAAELLDAAAVMEMEPHLGPGVVGGMSVPGEHIIDPWSTPIAFAEDALANGCSLMLGHRVVDVQVGIESTTLTTVEMGGSKSTVKARYLVNAAGLYSDVLHQAFGLDGFTIRPRRGELIVFDKLARSLLRRSVLPVPTAQTKGVLVAPTVFGNLMLGPTADDIDDRAATGSTADGIVALLAKGRKILPALLDEEVTAVYAGLRAATEHSDYQLSTEGSLRYVGLGGIRSTGLTAAMGLAEEALSRLRSIGLGLEPIEAPVLIRKVPLGEAGPRPYEQGGRIVCHCERVTEGEIAAACSGPIPAGDIDGLRRRTRTLSGRCQGFYCYAEVAALAGWDTAS